MAGSPTSLPSPEEQLDLHRRLVECDPTAPADLARVFMAALIAWLAQHNSRKIPEDLRVEAAGDALIALSKNPRSFDPFRPKASKSVFAYLCMSAQGDLRNRLQKENRHFSRHTRLRAVELSSQAGKYLGRDDDPSMPLQIQEETAMVNRQVLPSVREGLTDAELRVLDLMLQGERKTSVIAQACGLGHWPKKDQEAKVKRLKDKLKKRLERGGAGHGQSS